jgi:uncharacterized damage-inducible protein DinB
MNKEIQSISSNLRNTLEGEPWFGRPVYSILHEIDPALAYQKPNEQAHALTDLLYHMINWAAFTLSRIEKDRETGTGVFEKNDWREIDPAVHNWEKGLAEFIYLHNQILHKLSEKNDDFLNEKVDNRKYDFRFLLNGLIQHNIYHLGQIAYIKKMLE